MMNHIANQMLRLFSEDAGSPELRTPELGRFPRGSRKQSSHRDTRSMQSPATFAWMSYEQLQRM